MRIQHENDTICKINEYSYILQVLQKKEMRTISSLEEIGLYNGFHRSERGFSVVRKGMVEKWIIRHQHRR